MLHSLTAQKTIYHYLVVNLCILSTFLFNPRWLSRIISKSHIAVPACIILGAAIIIYLKIAFENYQDLMKLNIFEKHEKIPTNVEWVSWQKGMHKLERDFYLSMAALLAQALNIVVAHWVCKYDDLVEEMKKLRKVSENDK